MRSTEQQAFTAPEGIALRYGLLYGGDAEQMRNQLASRKVPVASGGLLAARLPDLPRRHCRHDHCRSTGICCGALISAFAGNFTSVAH
jgi:hypothetical protein